MQRMMRNLLMQVIATLRVKVRRVLSTYLSAICVLKSLMDLRSMQTQHLGFAVCVIQRVVRIQILVRTIMWKFLLLSKKKANQLITMEMSKHRPTAVKIKVIFLVRQILENMTRMTSSSTLKTGFKNAKELGDHFLAGKIASDGNTVVVVVGSLGALEFHQSRNPDDYGITGKDSFWRLVVDPYKRAKTLIMYGYDIYDALQTGEKALVGCCMIMNEDGYPMGQILYKIGRTRCSSPRADGFIYDLIDVK